MGKRYARYLKICKKLDITTNIAISRMGLSEMALTGCVAEPVFSMLMGLGGSMLRSSLTLGGTIKFNVREHVQAVMPLTGLGICMFLNTIFLVVNWRRGFQMSKILGIFQFACYAIFCGIIITLMVLLHKHEGHT